MRTTSEIRAEILSDTRWPALAARFEPAGVNGLTMFDAVRKVRLSQAAMTIRLEAEKTNTKMTEAAIDAAAHAAPSYVALIEQAVKDRETYVALAFQRDLLLGELRVAESLEALHETIVAA